MLLKSNKNGKFNLKTEPTNRLNKFVVPSTGNIEITGDTAIASETFSTDAPRVSWFLIGFTTTFLHSLRKVLSGA